MKPALLSLVSAFLLSTVFAQTPTPGGAPALGSAASPAPVAVAAVVPPAPNLGSAVTTLRALKAANEELLRKQTVTLQQLDELQKAVDQLKIYSKRG